MAAGRRVKRLREMVEQIQRLPASPARDRLLSEVRSRAVDVDTGVTPRAILPVREPAMPPDPPRPPKGDAAPRVGRTALEPPAPKVVLARPAAIVSGLPNGPEEPSPWDSDQLSLEDPLQLAPLPYVRGRGDRAIPPWALGLRG